MPQQIPLSRDQLLKVAVETMRNYSPQPDANNDFVAVNIGQSWGRTLIHPSFPEDVNYFATEADIDALHGDGYITRWSAGNAILFRVEPKGFRAVP